MYSREYEEISVLNAGSYGTVSLVEDRRRHRKFAAKRLNQGNWWCKCNCADEARHETRVRAIIKAHPNILRMEDSKDSELLIYEYCPRGDLYEAIKRGDITPQAARHVMLQLCEAVDHCHRRGVCHRDIKPENVLIGSDNQFKLGDFGLASIGRWCTDFGTGSESYMAPECFNGKDRGKYDAEAADVWSLGIVLLNVLFGRCPWKQSTSKDSRYAEFVESRESLYDNFPHLSQDVYDALLFSLSLDPKKRSLEDFKQAILKVEVWTTKEELARLSLTREAVPVPSSPRRTGSRPPLPLPTPRMGLNLSDVEEEWDDGSSYSSSLSHHSGAAPYGMFDFDEELERDSETTIVYPHQHQHQHHQAPELEHSPGTTDTSSGGEPHGTYQEHLSSASSAPMQTTSCSWADIDEEFYPNVRWGAPGSSVS